MVLLGREISKVKVNEQISQQVERQINRQVKNKKHSIEKPERVLKALKSGIFIYLRLTTNFTHKTDFS
ncbi:hypothetical protein MSHOH_2075 [Methanosarcina horonobensis HB-1 = JCM 15518]|uniref:Uncharacterized protein n=1 Tax=Methanosarcina horonobensis HB-1 = JCM 15518 TaxID=1434110 RepID=A0A0E3SG98_9EURY|nr:hypothetical protein MSHOH_2075 [Methanosarcina horonobensis HB-1 = JCM 15518]